MTPSNFNMVLIPQWDEERERAIIVVRLSHGHNRWILLWYTMIGVMGVFRSNFLHGSWLTHQNEQKVTKCKHWALVLDCRLPHGCKGAGYKYIKTIKLGKPCGHVLVWCQNWVGYTYVQILAPKTLLAKALPTWCITDVPHCKGGRQVWDSLPHPIGGIMRTLYQGGCIWRKPFLHIIFSIDGQKIVEWFLWVKLVVAK
jgi:hypothetical protein